MASKVTETRTRRSEETSAGERTQTELPWNVILHNDWHNPFNRVVWRLWKTIPDMTMKRATRITWEAHTKGRAIAKTCHKELAELYEERLREKGLTITVEPSR
jgi:ATP-dependent Clp protease adaptor protein ClpS